MLEYLHVWSDTMSSARSMLVAEFNKEFEELNRFFIDEVISNISMDIELDYFDYYDLDKINRFFGKGKEKVKNEDDLMDVLKLLLDNGYCTVVTHRKNALFYIPVFVYLLKHVPEKSMEFYELCMKVHLTKDKKALFTGEGLRNLEVPFRARMADTLEMVLLAPNFSTDLRTVMNLLDYIDYERFVNGENDSEYSKYLQRAEKELFAYFSFLASDKLLEEYYRNREGNTRDYKYTNIRFNKDTLKLMSCFIDTNVRECKNKFLEFKLLEDKLKDGMDISSRKDNMLVGFTYRVYPSDDFYDCFSDIDLTMTDLISFINRYEEMGNILTPRQLDNLLASYRNRYLEVNGLTDEFSFLMSSVEVEFEEYRKTRYAFLPNDFIRYYNSKYSNDFSSFNFGTSTFLTRDIYEMIINGNNIISFPDVCLTKSGGEYISSKNIRDYTFSSDNTEYKNALRIYDKYHSLLEECLFDSEFTIDYVIRKNVSEDDLEAFMKLKSWFDKYRSENWDYSNIVKERTFNQIQLDFDKELRNSPFKKRLEILYKYNDYVEHDGVKELMGPRFFYKPLHQFEKEFIENHGLFMFETVLGAYDSGADLLPVLEEFGLAIEDINLVFGSMGEEFSIRSAAFQRKAMMEAQQLEEIRLSERRTMISNERHELINAFVSDSEAYTLGEFCENNGISFGALKGARELTKEDSELCEMYTTKIDELRAGRNGSGGASIKEIYDGFINGVKRDDGTFRPFNYLDYRLMTDMPVRKFLRIANGEFGENFAIKEFGRLHQDLVKYNEECLLGEKYIIMVKGKPHEVTTEEKLAAFSFIQEYNLPREAKLYGLVIRGALNGDLGLDRDNDKPKIYVKKDN